MAQNLFSLKNEIISVGKRMYERGFIASNDGNISARLDDNRILITPTGISKGFMNPEDLVTIDFNGKIISGLKKPSSEFAMHIRVYKERSDVQSVCHAHPPYATGFAVAGIPLDKYVLPEVVILLDKIPLIEYGTPGTNEFVEPLIPYLKNYDAFLLANHGALAIGNNVLNAYHKMETIEHFAKIIFIAQQLGNVNALNHEQIQKIIALRENFGIRKNIGSGKKEENTKIQQNQKSPFIDNSKEEMVKRITEEISRKLKNK